MPACNCNSVIITPPTPTPQPCKDCLIARSAILPCDEGILPCGGTFSVDLTELFDATICGTGGYTVSLDGYDTTYLTNVTINGSYVLAGETVGTPPEGTLPWVRYRVECDDKINSARGTVRICILNPCSRKRCANTETCDPCTGDCNQGTVDLTTGGTPGGVGPIGGLQIG